MTTSEVVQPEHETRRNKHEEEEADLSNVELSFRGVITSDEIARLHGLFDDLVICPGLIGPFGTRVDPKGRIRIPGALTGFREAKLRFQGWQDNAKDSDKLKLWLEKLEERGREPLKGVDILNGIMLETWKAYQKLYSDWVNAQAQLRWRLKRRREALEREAEEERLAAEAQSKAASSAKELKGRQKKRGKTK